MPKTIDDVYIQRQVIQYIAAALGPQDVYSELHGSLASIIRDCKSDVVPYVHITTIFRWWKFFLMFGSTRAEWRRRRRKRVYTTHWSKEHTDKLKQIIDTYPDYYLDEIQDAMYTLQSGWWSTTTLWRKLREELKYSLQVATDKSFVANEEEQQEYQKALEERILRPNQLLYIDESQKDRNSSRRRRSWSRRGLTPFRPAYLQSAHGTRYSLLAACDVDGFIVEACETVEQSTGQNDKDLTRGTIDGDRFKLWVEEKILPVLGNYKRAEARSIVVMDNASIHANIRPLIEATGAKVIYTAPYSPELNPIELCFGHYKSSLRRLRNEPHWYAHAMSLKSVSPEISRAFYKHCGVPLCEHFPSQNEIARQEKILEDNLDSITKCCAVALVVLMKRKNSEDRRSGRTAKARQMNSSDH